MIIIRLINTIIRYINLGQIHGMQIDKKKKKSLLNELC